MSLGVGTAELSADIPILRDREDRRHNKRLQRTGISMPLIDNLSLVQFPGGSAPALSRFAGLNGKRSP
jgi:hypothetical protein